MVAERTRAMGPCTNLHPGDIAHRIYSGLRRYDLDDVVPIYVDDRGMAGFGIIWPGDHTFDAVMRVGLDGHPATLIVEGLADIAGAGAPVETDVIGDDIEMTTLLTGIGFTAGSADYVLTESQLGAPAASVPHGFTIRSATFADTEQLAAVHAGAFGSGWSAANYAERMHKPGYDPRDEIVAVDASGVFMGFAVTWLDDLNKVGYFEPVGVHRDFRRRCIGSALLSVGKERMLGAGMDTATVWHAAHDDRAVAFYRSNGFTAANPVTRWVRN